MIALAVVNLVDAAGQAWFGQMDLAQLAVFGRP